MTDQQKVQLLPCPFCGYHAGIMAPKKSTFAQRSSGYGRYQYGVACQANLVCACRVYGFTDQESANQAWNTRQAALAHASSATTNTQESSSRLVDAMDAARYRWLRERNEGCQGDMLPWACRGTVTTGLSHWNRDALDEAIDQAIAGRRGEAT